MSSRKSLRPVGPRAYAEHVGGAKIRYTWPCGHSEVKELRNPPRKKLVRGEDGRMKAVSVPQPVSEAWAKRMARYWSKEHGGVQAGPCPTCEREQRKNVKIKART